MKRDPDTGQFVSGTGDRDLKTIGAGLKSRIAAADLSGGTKVVEAFGDTARLIDFSSELDNDEVFEIVGMFGHVTADMPTTATAESHGEINWNVVTNLGGISFNKTNPHFGGGVDSSDGIIDVNSNQTKDSLIGGTVNVSGSVGDSTNGLGAGGDSPSRVFNINYDQLGDYPAFDRDDEITVPHQFAVDNVTDHGVTFACDLQLYGEVTTLD